MYCKEKYSGTDGQILFMREAETAMKATKYRCLSKAEYMQASSPSTSHGGGSGGSSSTNRPRPRSAARVVTPLLQPSNLTPETVAMNEARDVLMQDAECTERFFQVGRYLMRHVPGILDPVPAHVELSPSSKSARSLAIAARNLEPTMAGHRLAMASLSQQPARGVSAATAIALESTATRNLEQNNDTL